MSGRGGGKGRTARRLRRKRLRESGGGGGGLENSTSLLVRNLRPDCRKEDLQMSFSRFGPLKDVHLPMDYNTGTPRGFGFIEFVEPAHAAEAINCMNGKVVFGRMLNVVFAEEKRKNANRMKERARGLSNDRIPAPPSPRRSPFPTRYSPLPYRSLSPPRYSSSPRHFHSPPCYSHSPRRFRSPHSYSPSPRRSFYSPSYSPSPRRSCYRSPLRRQRSPSRSHEDYSPPPPKGRQYARSFSPREEMRNGRGRDKSYWRSLTPRNEHYRDGRISEQFPSPMGRQHSRSVSSREKRRNGRERDRSYSRSLSYRAGRSPERSPSPNGRQYSRSVSPRVKKRNGRERYRSYSRSSSPRRPRRASSSPELSPSTKHALSLWWWCW